MCFYIDARLRSGRTPGPRAAPKSCLDRKHWSLTYPTNPSPTDTQASSVDRWSKARIRYTPSLNSHEMVTQGTTKVRQPKMSSWALIPSDMDTVANPQSPPRAVLSHWIPPRRVLSQVFGHHHQLSSSKSTTPASLHVSSWVLPPIPTFTELGLGFDQSHVNDEHASSSSVLPHHGNTLNLGERQNHPLDSSEMQEQYTPQEQEQQQLPNSSSAGAITTDAPLIRSESMQINLGEECCCNFPVPSEIDRSTTIANMAPTYTTSIFDDVQSDDNESYIVWSTPLAPSSAKLSVAPTTLPMGLTAATTPATGAPSLPTPSRPTYSVSVQPSPSISAEASTSLPPQSSPSTRIHNEPCSASISGQVQSISRRRSAAEPSKGKGKEGDMDSAKLDQSPSSKRHPREEEPLQVLQHPTARIGNAHDGTTPSRGTSPSLQTPKTLAAVSTLASTDINHVIMAATVEKLVQKLTSEIGKKTR